MRRCASAGAYAEVCEHALWAVPHVLRVLSGVHALWSPAARQLLPANLHPALAMTKEEIAVFLAKRLAGLGGNEEAEALAMPASPEAEDLRGWLRGLRDSGYGLLAVALAPSMLAKGEPTQGGGTGPASPRSVVAAAAGVAAGAVTAGSPGAKPGAPPVPEGLYATEGVAEALAAALLTDLPSMEGRHLRTMVRGVIHPVLARCPPPRRRVWFGAILPSLLPHCHSRLVSGWSALVSSPGFARGSAEGSASAAEVVQERILRDLARSHLSMLSAFATLDTTPPPGHVRSPAPFAHPPCISLRCPLPPLSHYSSHAPDGFFQFFLSAAPLPILCAGLHWRSVPRGRPPLVRHGGRRGHTSGAGVRCGVAHVAGLGRGAQRVRRELPPPSSSEPFA